MPGSGSRRPPSLPAEGAGGTRPEAGPRARARLGPGWVAAWAARLLGPPPPAGDAARLRPGERRPLSPRVPVLPPACGHWPSLIARYVNWSLLETTDRTPVDTACLCTCACLCVLRGVPVRAARAPLCATGVPACTQGRVACWVGGCRAEPPPGTPTPGRVGSCCASGFPHSATLTRPAVVVPSYKRGQRGTGTCRVCTLPLGGPLGCGFHRPVF